jgi:hypothetical protein
MIEPKPVNNMGIMNVAIDIMVVAGGIYLHV